MKLTCLRAIVYAHDRARRTGQPSVVVRHPETGEYRVLPRPVPRFRHDLPLVYDTEYGSGIQEIAEPRNG